MVLKARDENDSRDYLGLATICLKGLNWNTYKQHFKIT